MSATLTSTDFTPHMITDEYMQDLWAKIERLQEMTEKHPDDRLYPMMLDGCLRNYESKLKIQMQDEQER